MRKDVCNCAQTGIGDIVRLLQMVAVKRS